MRKKLALFSSLLALPTVLAARDQSAVHDAVRNVFNILPLDIWNTFLAFMVTAAIINGALSMTSLGKNRQQMPGAGLISVALGGIMGIFVYTTKFDFITFVLPFLFILIIIVLFALIMPWIMPNDDEKARERARGTALLITGFLLIGLHGAITSFQEYLESFAAQIEGETVGYAAADIIMLVGPFTTLAGLIFIAWGAAKLNEGFRSDSSGAGGAIRTGGALAGIYERFAGRKNPKVTINLPSPPEATVGAPVTFDAHITGGSGTYTGFNWTIPDPGSGNTNYPTKTAAHTYTGDGDSNVTLEVTDDKGNVGTAKIKITVNPAGGGLNPTFTVHETGPPLGPDIGMGNDVLIGISLDFRGVAAAGGTPPYIYTWDFGGAPGTTTPIPAPGPNPTINNTFAPGSAGPKL